MVVSAVFWNGHCSSTVPTTTGQDGHLWKGADVMLVMLAVVRSEYVESVGHVSSCVHAGCGSGSFQNKARAWAMECESVSEGSGQAQFCNQRRLYVKP